MHDENIIIRDEQSRDHATVRAVNIAAFAQEDEALLIDRLRDIGVPMVSLVAEIDGTIVGHILFTPVVVEADDAPWQAMAIGPMAVEPKWQRRGVGSALVEEGLQRCNETRTPAVFVLGHPSYYPRFGFTPASRIGCRCQWNVSDDVFMAKVLAPSEVYGGLVHYHPIFDELD